MRSGSAAVLAICGAPVAMVAMVASAPAFAQDYTSGALAGDVVNVSGAPVAGATVKLTSEDQGFSRTTTTTSNGGFRFAAVPPGAYTVAVSSTAGNASQEGVRITASTTADYTFTVGESPAGSEIVVTGARENQDFSTTTTGINIDLTRLVDSVPIGRSLTDVALLAPTATAGDSTFGALPAFGGSSVAENAYYIDLPPSEWSKIDDILDDEGDKECRARSIARKRSLASCVKLRLC
ncbi:hypothetical protein WP12_23145, partial [Sphingomonas sp. SRS2]